MVFFVISHHLSLDNVQVLFWISYMYTAFRSVTYKINGYSHFSVFFFFFSFFLIKGGTPDYHRAYVHFITRFRKGMLGRVLLDRDLLKEKQHFLPASGHSAQDYL